MTSPDPILGPTAGLNFFDCQDGLWVLAATPTPGVLDTQLVFRVNSYAVELVSIRVHPSDRGRHVALGMVHRVADKFPRPVTKFTGMNALSRRLARRCEDVIPGFDADWAQQAPHEASDRAHGFYDDPHIDVSAWENSGLAEIGMPNGYLIGPDGLQAAASRRWRKPWRRPRR